MACDRVNFTLPLVIYAAESSASQEVGGCFRPATVLAHAPRHRRAMNVAGARIWSSYDGLGGADLV